MTTPAPKGAGPAGKRLWLSVLDRYDLDEHEAALLVQAVRTVDLCERLEAIVTADGPVIDSPQGRKAHPAAVELRQQRLTFARLLAALRLPEDDAGRPQRRVGVRGVHRVGP